VASADVEDRRSVPKAGWYPDPSGRFDLRYFDGTSWTHHVSVRGQPGVDSLSAHPPAVVWVSAIAPPSANSNGMATASLVLGVGAAAVSATIVFGIIALPVAIAAFVLGLLAHRRSARDPRRIGRDHAIAGMALGSAAAIVSIIGIVVTGAWINHLGEQWRESFAEREWSIIVVSVSDEPTVPNAPLLRGSRYVAVEINAVNQGLGHASAAPRRFHLEDAQGATYSRCACTSAPGGLRAPPEGVPPGGSITGTVWFAVPDGGQPTVLIWYQDVFTRTQINLPR
jgi:hypothetical protein